MSKTKECRYAIYYKNKKGIEYNLFPDGRSFKTYKWANTIKNRQSFNVVEAHGELYLKEVPAPKFYGKIIFESEGCIYWHEFKTEAEAVAYAMGAKDGIECADPDDDCYTVCYDQIEPTEIN